MAGRKQAPSPRRSRAERREETRQQVLDAALEVFGERGFASTSVEEIAARAGFTRGAFYSNFADKDAVFLALMDDRMADRVAEITNLMSVSSPLAVFADLQAWSSDASDGPERLRLTAEFRAHAMRDPMARRQLEIRDRALREAYGRAIAAQFDAVGVEPPAPIVQIAVIVQALDMMMPQLRAIDPKGVPESALFDALSLLFAAGVSLSEARSAATPAKRARAGEKQRR